MRSARELATLVALCLVAPAASAHAVLMDSSPKAGQMLDVAPAEVSVTFNEGVGPIFFKVLDRSGKEVGKPGEIRLDGLRMVLPLGETLPNGTYLLTYRVISADTHPVGTTFGFSIGEPMADTSSMTAAAGTASTPWTYAVAANRWLLYAAMLLAAGSALSVLLLALPDALLGPTFRAGRFAAIAATVAYVLSIGVGGAEMVLGGAGALFSGQTWMRGLSSTLTPSAAIGVPAMLLLFWAFSAPAGQRRGGALALGAVAAIGSFLVTGHAATAPPVWLMATTVGVHLTCTAFWFGSLYPLYRSTQLLALKESGALLTRFSMRAVYAVGLIVLSGLVISWTQLQSPANLLSTDYGAGLVRKLVFFVIVVLLAAYNKIVLTPAIERGEASAGARFRRSVSLESFIYVGILGAAMALTLDIPPRAIVAQGVGGAALGVDAIRKTVQAQGYSLELELTPARAGENMLMATVRDAGGQVLTGMADLEVVAALESAGISEIRLKGENMGNGMWHVMIKDMVIPGVWTLGIDAFITDYDKVEFKADVDIR